MVRGCLQGWRIQVDAAQDDASLVCVAKEAVSGPAQVVAGDVWGGCYGVAETDRAVALPAVAAAQAFEKDTEPDRGDEKDAGGVDLAEGET